MDEITSIFDHCFTYSDGDCLSYVVVPNLSDHYAIALVHAAHANDKSTIVRFRDFSSASIENFFKHSESDFG